MLLRQIAPDVIGGDPRWRISLELPIENDGGAPVTLEEVYIDGALASDFLTGGLPIGAGDGQTSQNCRCGKVEGVPGRNDAHGSRIVIARPTSAATSCGGPPAATAPGIRSLPSTPTTSRPRTGSR